MKINKFNENKNDGYCYCAHMIDDEVNESHIFDDKENMYNWILNFINAKIPDRLYMIDDDTEGIVEIDDEEYVFHDVVDAMNWFSEEGSEYILYDSNIDIKTEKVELKYGVDKIKATKKFNI